MKNNEYNIIRNAIQQGNLKLVEKFILEDFDFSYHNYELLNYISHAHPGYGKTQSEWYVHIHLIELFLQHNQFPELIFIQCCENSIFSRNSNAFKYLTLTPAFKNLSFDIKKSLFDASIKHDFLDAVIYFTEDSFTFYHQDLEKDALHIALSNCSKQSSRYFFNLYVQQNLFNPLKYSTHFHTYIIQGFLPVELIDDMIKLGVKPLCHPYEILETISRKDMFNFMTYYLSLQPNSNKYINELALLCIKENSIDSLQYLNQHYSLKFSPEYNPIFLYMQEEPHIWDSEIYNIIGQSLFNTYSMNEITDMFSCYGDNIHPILKSIHYINMNEQIIEKPQHLKQLINVKKI